MGQKPRTLKRPIFHLNILVRVGEEGGGAFALSPGPSPIFGCGTMVSGDTGSRHVCLAQKPATTGPSDAFCVVAEDRSAWGISSVLRV